MKIIIDTKEDSHEDIRKVLQLLSQLLGEKTAANEPQQELSEESGTLLADMFGQAKTEETKNTKTTNDDEDENLKIIPY